MESLSSSTVTTLLWLTSAALKATPGLIPYLSIALSSFLIHFIDSSSSIYGCYYYYFPSDEVDFCMSVVGFFEDTPAECGTY
jgi:hypothetical protein